MMSNGREYELFVQTVYNILVNEESFKNISVQHNVKLEGKSGCSHQIDVYWEFEVAGEKVKFIIECKNYKNPVEISTVRDFFGVLHDIGNVKGIIATKIGYQKGAKVFADHYGISLKLIKEPEEKDWNKRLRGVNLNIIVQYLKIKKVDVLFDKDWVNEEIGDIKASDINVSSNINQEVVIYDEKGTKQFDMRELEELIPRSNTKAEDLIYELDFSKVERYIETNHGHTKVHKIVVLYNENPVFGSIEIDAMHFTLAVIKDIKTDEVKFIRNQ